MHKNDYSGRESGQIQAVQWIAEAVRKDPGKTITIEVMRYHDQGDITQAWGWLDFGFKYFYPAANVTTADVRPGDDFHGLEFLGADRDLHSVACMWDGYELVWESRRYAICQRRP